MTDGNIRLIAEHCHETNRVYCELIGDYSQKRWNEAEEWQRKSSLERVRYLVNHPGCGLDSSLHTYWMKNKIEDGWKFGKVKDIKLKRHPHLVPFHELPILYRAKDAIFKLTVERMLDGGD